MKELNLTEGKGKWEVFEPPMTKNIMVLAGYTIVADSLTIDNAQAIVTAVNNTYHKGIDPEGIPKLVEVLRRIHKAPVLDNGATLIGDDLGVEMRLALQKATINEKE